jgi:PD-(D/E)XK nuclease superfamily
MNTNKSELLLLKNEVFQVVGCAIEVLNTLGHGLFEKPYENALMLNYLRITGLRVGVILNFKHPKLEWERIAL